MQPDGSKLPRVSVVIPTCRREQLLFACIDSILNGEYQQFEIIIVDQDPARTLEAALAKKYPGEDRIRYVYQKEQAADQARNTGFGQARAEIVVVADDDVEVTPHWLTAYIEAFESESKPALVAGKLEAKYLTERPAWWPSDYDYLLGIYSPEETGLSALPGNHLPISANLAVLKSVWAQVGGFDERVDYSYARKGAEMLTGGDSLFGQRARDAGLKILYQPKALAFHAISERKLNRRWLLKRSFWEGCTQAVLAYLSRPSTRYHLGGMERVHWAQLPGHLRHVFRPARMLAGMAHNLGVVYCSRKWLRRQELPGGTPVRLGKEVPLRIGVDCHLLSKEIGGMKQYFLTTMEWLLRHDTANQYVFFHYDRNAEELAKLPTRWKEGAVRLENQVEVLRHVDQFDVFFAPFGAYWPRGLGRPAVVTVMDLQEVRYPEFFSPNDRFERAKNFPTSTRAADRVLAISRFTKETIVEHHKVPAEKVRAVHLSADDRYYRAADVERPLEVSLPAEFILYPANRWKHKNHDALLRAMSLLRQGGTDVHALFTGYDMPGGYSLAGHAKEYGIEDLVHQIGYVSVEQMCWLYRRARGLVFPSLYEGFGLPLVEAFAAGCAVASSDRTSLPEIAGDAAVLFDPEKPESIAEAVGRLWHDGKLRDGFIARGRERAKEFSIERTARAHLELFRTAVEAYSPARAWYQRRIYEPLHLRRTLVLRALGYYNHPRTRS